MKTLSVNSGILTKLFYTLES